MSITIIGPKELTAFDRPLSIDAIRAPEVPFDPSVLERCADSHILFLTPATYADGSPVTLNSLRELFGTDPTHEPCLYNQDWYLKEDFAAKTALDGKWHLLPKNVREDMRAKRPEEIESSLSGEEQFPTAVAATFAFFAYWSYTGGEKLWKHDFLWCSDRDHNGDRIYVGRYEDPTGVNKNGFNIHRHLALRPAYSAAPEILT